MKIDTTTLTERYEELCFVSMAVEQELHVMNLVMNVLPATIEHETYTFVAYNMDEETITLQREHHITGAAYTPTMSFEAFEQLFAPIIEV